MRVWGTQLNCSFPQHSVMLKLNNPTMGNLRAVTMTALPGPKNLASFIHSFIHLFDKSILSASFGPGTGHQSGQGQHRLQGQGEHSCCGNCLGWGWEEERVLSVDQEAVGQGSEETWRSGEGGGCRNQASTLWNQARAMRVGFKSFVSPKSQCYWWAHYITSGLFSWSPKPAVTFSGLPGTHRCRERGENREGGYQTTRGDWNSKC